MSESDAQIASMADPTSGIGFQPSAEEHKRQQDIMASWPPIVDEIFHAWVAFGTKHGCRPSGITVSDEVYAMLRSINPAKCTAVRHLCTESGCSTRLFGMLVAPDDACERFALQPERA